MSIRPWLAAIVVIELTGACAPQVGSATPVGTPKTAAPGTDEWCVAPLRKSKETDHGVSGGLAQLNTLFLEAHADARRAACAALESKGLVIRYAFNSLEARYDGQPLLGGKVNLTPPSYHPIKDVSHAVFLAALLFSETRPNRKRLESALKAVDTALTEFGDPNSVARQLIPTQLMSQQEELLTKTKKALTAFSDGKLDEVSRREYFREVRPLLEANLRTIAGDVLRALHKHVTRIRQEVTTTDPKAWDSVVVVIGIMHQARAREIGVQYFLRLLGEQADEGARSEKRLVIAEGIVKASEQYGALSTHLVDQVGSTLVFEDPQRLQWDVLADDGGVLNQLLPAAAGP